MLWKLGNISGTSVDLTKKLYVGNLPFSASEHEVKELFENHVHARLPVLRVHHLVADDLAVLLTGRWRFPRDAQRVGAGGARHDVLRRRTGSCARKSRRQRCSKQLRTRPTLIPFTVQYTVQPQYRTSTYTVHILYGTVFYYSVTPKLKRTNT